MDIKVSVKDAYFYNYINEIDEFILICRIWIGFESILSRSDLSDQEWPAPEQHPGAGHSSTGTNAAWTLNLSSSHISN